MLARIATLLAIAAIAVALAAVAFTASQPADYLMRDLVIDDAIYYLKTAQNFVAGHGYSLDGRHLTNGVQPLWALVVTGIAFATDDALAAIRAMVLLSGGCWVAGGCLLFVLLRPLHPLSGLLALLVWLMAGFGFHVRLAMLGMENGVNGFVLMLALLHGSRLAAVPAAAPEWHRRAMLFGLTVTLLALARVENGACAALFATWIGIRQARAAGSWRGSLRAWSFVLPIALVGAASLALSRWYAGEWLPISGTMKAWQSRADLSGVAFVPALQNAALTAVSVSLSGIAVVLIELVAPRLVPLLERAPTTWELVGGTLAAGLLPVLPRFPGWLRLRPGSLPATAPVYVVLVAFVCVHLLALSLFLLPALVSYGAWYFVPEIALVAVAVGGIAGALRTWWQWLLVLPLATIVLGSTAVRMPTWFRATPTGVTAPYVDLGRWLEAWLPPGSTVGAKAAGYVALEARSHTVINLDGLINDGRYVREYMMQNRVRDYFAAEGIQYFADNLQLGEWQIGARPDQTWFPPNLRPLHCWPTAPGQVVAVLATAEAGATAPAHPLGALFFRALALGEHKTIADGERAVLTADQQIVATYIDAPSREVRHVAVPRALAVAQVDPAGLVRFGALRIAFGETLQLEGVETTPAVAPGRTLVRVYLRAGPQVAAAGELELALRIGDAEPPRLEQIAAPAFGTLPVAQWQPGDRIAHTFVVDLPAGFPSGHHTLRFGIQPKGGTWIATGDGADTHPHVGALQVRAK